MQKTKLNGDKYEVQFANLELLFGRCITIKKLIETENESREAGKTTTI